MGHSLSPCALGQYIYNLTLTATHTKKKKKLELKAVFHIYKCPEDTFMP